MSLRKGGIVEALQCTSAISVCFEITAAVVEISSVNGEIRALRWNGPICRVIKSSHGIGGARCGVARASRVPPRSRGTAVGDRTWPVAPGAVRSSTIDSKHYTANQQTVCSGDISRCWRNLHPCRPCCINRAKENVECLSRLQQRGMCHRALSGHSH
jgi:hypothetical protein